MTVGDLIEKLKVYDKKLPICIDEHMGFVEAYEETIEVEKKKFICFPFTEYDEFEYVNLKNTILD